MKVPILMITCKRGQWLLHAMMMMMMMMMMMKLTFAVS